VLHTQLCLPRLSSTSKKGMVNELKKALSAPIEGKMCCWTSQMNRMSKFQRMSVSMSLFLFRKVLPAEEPSIEEFVERVQQPSPEPDAEFLDFAGQLVDKVFRLVGTLSTAIMWTMARSVHPPVNREVVLVRSTWRPFRWKQGSDIRESVWVQK